MEEPRKVYKVLVGKSDGKRPLGRLGMIGKMEHCLEARRETCS
jgi:hypothetical protein